jgi:hypothetical protein
VAAAAPVLKTAFADKDWAVRVRAARLMAQLDPAAAQEAAAQIRPAPTTLSAEVYAASRLTNPTVSTQAYIETDRGTIQIELAVLDAPLTVESFIALARKGFSTASACIASCPTSSCRTAILAATATAGPAIRSATN